MSVQRGRGAQWIWPCLLFGLSACFAKTNLWRKQWDASAVLKPFEKRRIRKFTEAGYHVGYVTHPHEGVQLGKDDENIAVDKEAMERLAKEPVILRLDRSGRAIKEGEKVDGLLPWSLKDGRGLHSAQAPKGWEDFHARYGQMEKGVEGTLGPQALNELQSNLARYEGKDNFRVIRTLSWPGGVDGGGPTSIMLIGVADMSTRSLRLATRAVYEVEPSALMLELCRERIGKQLVMPREHKEAVANYARGFATTNPHRHSLWLHHLDTIQGDAEALNQWTRGQPYGEALADFASQSPGKIPRLLCLGDVRSSTMERLEKKYRNESTTTDSTRSSRARQMARGLISMASTGHKVVLGLLDTDHLGPVSAWLERAGAKVMAVADASDIESNRESLAADIKLGLASGKASPAELQLQATKVAAQARMVLELDAGVPLGFFLNEEGVQLLEHRKRRLLQLTRLKDLVKHREKAKTWETAEELYVVVPGEKIPGPESRLPGQTPEGLQFEMGRLEIPDHYLRDAGMEGHAESLWKSLVKTGKASEPADPSELQWWASGGIEAAEPGLWEHPENASFDRSLGLCIVCMLKIVEHFIATWSCAMQVEPLNDEFWQQD
ncbi:unnamed protein product [Durusdinium trenchii]|uniref:Uncharacterized protein n=1 Tax=Durusdinium trenchii TaxID=1381693 RepID=A0ABP0LVX8_9DINO